MMAYAPMIVLMIFPILIPIIGEVVGRVSDQVRTLSTRSWTSDQVQELVEDA